MGAKTSSNAPTTPNANGNGYLYIPRLAASFIGHSAKTALPSVFSALGKDGFAECFFSALGKDVFCRVLFFGTRQNASLPSAFFLALGKDVFYRVPFFGTRQNVSLPSAFFLALDKDVFCRVPLFWHSAKRHFAVCIFFALGKSVFQSNFWGPKWIQIKNFLTTKLYNFSRSTKFILVISSFDKATITLFLKSTSLSYLSY